MSDKQLAELIDLVMSFLTEQTTDLLGALDAYAEKHEVSPSALKTVVRGLFFVCFIIIIFIICLLLFYHIFLFSF